MAIVSLNDLPPGLAALAIADFYANGYWNGGMTTTVRDTADIFEWQMDENGNPADEIQTYGGELIPLAEMPDWKRRIRAFGVLGAKKGNGSAEGGKRGGGRKPTPTDACLALARVWNASIREAPQLTHWQRAQAIAGKENSPWSVSDMVNADQSKLSRGLIRGRATLARQKASRAKRNGASTGQNSISPGAR